MVIMDARLRYLLHSECLLDLPTPPAFLPELAHGEMLCEARFVQEALPDQLGDDALDLLPPHFPRIKLVAHLLLRTLLPGAIGTGFGKGFVHGKAACHGVGSRPRCSN
jgi:hypothetical protein